MMAGWIRFIVGKLPSDEHTTEETVPVQELFDVAIDLGDGIDRLLFHVSIPPTSARCVRMATPRALSVEYWGGAKTA